MAADFDSKILVTFRNSILNFKTSFVLLKEIGPILNCFVLSENAALIDSAISGITFETKTEAQR